MELRILGPIVAAVDGRAITLRGSRERVVLATLLVCPNRVVPIDTMVRELWPVEPPAAAVRALHVFVSRLRGSLRGAGAELPIVTTDSGYMVTVDPHTIDAVRFDELRAEARSQASHGRHEFAAGTLSNALMLWRGPALADAGDGPVVRAEAARLNEARAGALEERLEALLACGRHDGAVAELESLTAVHPFRERLWALRMLALYRCGRQVEALRAYQEVRGILRGELGLEPSAELSRLEQDILRHDPALNLHAVGDREAHAIGRAGQSMSLVFSEIEAGTRRWKDDPAAMARDLAQHDELLTGVFVAAGGEVFDHTGDGLCAAFGSPVAALAAAVAGQRALTSAGWTGTGPLAVRIAVHVGRVERRSGNFFGPALNRTARLLALASGGQILCSRAAAEQIGADLPLDVTLCDLGDHRLADLAPPEQVFQVEHPSLPTAFPPLRTPSTMRHNLPAQLSSFIGRQAEVGEVTARLEGTRLLTLVGSGGAGKTRLALQAGTASLNRFPGGVWFVELAAVPEEAAIATALARAVRLPLDGLQDEAAVLENVCRCLQAKQALLIVDNCEHVIWGAARTIQAVLAACAGVSVLATSREPLALPGETAWRVPPLSLPPPAPSSVDDLADSDAVALFTDRARSVRPELQITEANMRSVAEICHRLDGIPLALELAAAQVRAAGIDDVAQRLADSFRFLPGNTRTAAARHRTLQATLDWSYELLPGGEQSTLRQLGVFPATFSLHAAEAVAAKESSGPDVFATIARLVDKSLVTVLDEGDSLRYRLLESVRSYARHKLVEAGELAAAEARHQAYFVRLTHAWAATGFHWPLRLVAVEQDNLRAALTRAWRLSDIDSCMQLVAAQWQLWLWSGQVDGCEWTKRVVTEARRRGHAIPFAVLVGLAYLLTTFGHAGPVEMEALLLESVEVARRGGDATEEAFAQWVLGSHLVAGGHVARAREVLDKAATEFERAHTADGIAWCHHDLGWAAVAEQDLATALVHFERIVPLAERGVLHEWITPHVLAGAAPVVATNDPDRATRLARDAVASARHVPSRMILVMALVRAAETALLCDRDRESAAILEELLSLLHEIQARRWVADTIELVGLLCAADCRRDDAAVLLGSAAAIRDALGEPVGGVRVIAPRIRRTRSALAQRLGRRRYAQLEEIGRTGGPTAAIPDALRALGKART